MPLTRASKSANSGWSRDDGYVTVEAAFVFSALTILVLLLVSGLYGLAQYNALVSVSRDASRLLALGASEDSARSYAQSQMSSAQVEITYSDITELGLTPDQLPLSATPPEIIHVTTRVNIPVINMVSSTHTIVGEPDVQR